MARSLYSSIVPSVYGHPLYVSSTISILYFYIFEICGMLSAELGVHSLVSYDGASSRVPWFSDCFKRYFAISVSRRSVGLLYQFKV